jgi:hypothetical protein
VPLAQALLGMHRRRTRPRPGVGCGLWLEAALSRTSGARARSRRTQSHPLVFHRNPPFAAVAPSASVHDVPLAAVQQALHQRGHGRRADHAQRLHGRAAVRGFLQVQHGHEARDGGVRREAREVRGGLDAQVLFHVRQSLEQLFRRRRDGLGGGGARGLV